MKWSEIVSELRQAIFFRELYKKIYLNQRIGISVPPSPILILLKGFLETIVYTVTDDSRSFHLEIKGNYIHVFKMDMQVVLRWHPQVWKGRGPTPLWLQSDPSTEPY